MSVQSLRRRFTLASAAALTLFAAACSPTLNWREVPLEGLVALLPCKPDHAQRPVQLGSQNTVLQMSGCEAGGALYAISHVHVADAASANATQAAWRQATLASLQARVVQTLPLQLTKALPGQTYAAAAAARAAGPADKVFRLEKLEGKRPDGAAVEAQVAWLPRGLDIYHVAVYGSRLDRDMTELLFSELRLQ